MRSGFAHGRRFFRSTLQPIAENLEYNPVSIAARYRSNYLGSVSLPTQTQAASYSVSSSDEPTRGGSTPDEVPGQALDPNRVPPEGSLDRQGSGKVSKGHDSPTREELERAGSTDSSSEDNTTSGAPAGGPSGRLGDPHVTDAEGMSHNARPGEFAPNDPKAPAENTPENARNAS
ncbi:hypothetical protein COCOBI_07-6170 [Coccomyxa sp. Obi]|nr:hypothetical protein COCOBI_07-6170 [Coccomyxa sp. Obi]